MTDAKSEGPYKLVGGVFEGPNGFNFRIVWGPDFKLDDKIVHEEIIKIANQAHAEGRKSMDKDFKELLDLANGMEGMLKEIWATYVPSHAPGFEMKFNAWKKARGII